VAKYIVRRLIGAIPVLFGLSLILFAFVHLLPGDPSRAILGQHATPELVARVRENLGLDKPLYEQYVIYLGASVITGTRSSPTSRPDSPGRSS
jgi:ABC-type dipeptide/oligopeptide/nickel transport system permease component